MTTELRAKLEAAAAASNRPVSEEIERRLEETFIRQSTAEVAGKAAAEAASAAVTATAERLEIARRASLETIFSTLEEFEIIVGGKDACSFAAHAGQSVAHFVRRDEKDHPGAGPWWEDPDRREAIRSKVLKSTGGLVDNWDFVQKSSMVPSVGWIIAERIRVKSASGEYDRRAEEAAARAAAEDTIDAPSEGS